MSPDGRSRRCAPRRGGRTTSSCTRRRHRSCGCCSVTSAPGADRLPRPRERSRRRRFSGRSRASAPGSPDADGPPARSARGDRRHRSDHRPRGRDRALVRGTPCEEAVAEIAFLEVVDACQGRGLGRRLARELGLRARRAGPGPASRHRRARERAGLRPPAAARDDRGDAARRRGRRCSSPCSLQAGCGSSPGRTGPPDRGAEGSAHAPDGRPRAGGALQPRRPRRGRGRAGPLRRVGRARARGALRRAGAPRPTAPPAA